MTDGFITISEFGETYALSRSSCYRLFQRGEIQIIKIGRSTRIARADAAAWARNLPSRGAARAVGAE